MKRIAVLAIALAACADGSAGPLLTEAGSGRDSGGGISGDLRCTGTRSGTFDNVTVPVGATCTLENSTVQGNLKALENSRLYVSNTRVHGNVQGDKASIVHVTGGRVDGNIQIVQGTSPGALGVAITGGTVVTGGDIQIEKMVTGRILIEDARVDNGNIQVVENSTSGGLDIVRNRTGANMQVFKNVGAGAKTVRENTVAQDLQCKENTSPFTGSPNTAGDKEDQCR